MPLSMPLIGGQTMIAADSSRGGVAGGTLGLVLKTHQGKRAFLTAGHVVGRPKSKVYSAGHVIGTVSINLFTGENSKSDDEEPDIAVVHIADDVADDDLLPMQLRGSRGDKTIEKTLTGFNADQLPVRTPIMFAGALTGMHVATIIGKTTLVVSKRRGETHHEVDVMTIKMKIGDKPTKPGDSGGPVYHGNALVGIYAGKYSKEGRVTHYFVPSYQFESHVSSW